ncbi:MAG: ATP-binding cassette domain-containing protein [Brevinematia bacterium]
MALSVQNITLSYDGKTHIISNLSFDLVSGDILLIEGRNGIGKTTILKSIAGLIKPIHGKILINNYDIHLSPNSLRYFLVSFAQQSPNYSSPIRVIEFIEMANLNYSFSYQKRMKKFVNLLEIENLLFKPLNTLSDGQKKLVLLCRTFIQNTKVVLLDEPEAFLDIYNQKLIVKAIKEISNEGKIVTFVSHNQSFYSQIYNKKLQILSSEKFWIEKEIFYRRSL